MALCAPMPNRNIDTELWRRKKEWLYCFTKAKGEHSRIGPQALCLHPWWVGKDYIVRQEYVIRIKALVVQSISHVLLFVTAWTAALQACLSFSISQSLFKFMSIKLVMPSNHPVPRHPLLLLPSILPSIWVFSNELALHIRWPKYWSFSFSISPSNEYSGLISFRSHWFDLLAVQGTLQSLLQHHSSKASFLWYSAYLVVQISHPYMTTGKTIALTIWNFIGKIMSLLFNMLSRFVTAFLPRSKTSFNFMATITILSDFGAQKIKSVTVSIVFPSICHEVMGPEGMILFFFNIEF